MCLAKETLHKGSLHFILQKLHLPTLKIHFLFPIS